MPGGVAPRPSTRLLLKRREVAEVERALQRRREVRADPGPSVCPLPGCCTPGTARAVHGMLPSPMFLQEVWQRMERLAQRRQQLDQREQRLRDVVLKFTAFLKVRGRGWGWGGHGGPADPVPTPQASAARQERVLQRTAEVRAQAAEQDAEAARLHQQLAGLQRRRDRLAQRLQSLQRFHSCLQDVLARMGQVSASPGPLCGASPMGCSSPPTPAGSEPPLAAQFQDIPSMLAHFEALLALRAALAQEAEAGQERLARSWARIRGYREETPSKLLCIATERAQLRACLEAAHREVLQGVRRDMGCIKTRRGAAEGPQYLTKRGMPNVVVVVSWVASPGLSQHSPCAHKAASSAWGRHSQDPRCPCPIRGGVAGVVAGKEGKGSLVLCPGVLLGPCPKHGHREDPAAGADQAGSAQPLPSRHCTAQGPGRRGPGGH